MKRIITLTILFTSTIWSKAQQVNPVPDYVFANRMSAGRNTVTDTAAYFSIGPRYGATRGMMPPMVVDTASFSANKRNGLLIFSVQKNKFLYWDSVGVKWAEMAGTAGSALTSADTAALLSTRAWRQKGIDSLAAIRIAGSGTTNYVPKFTAASTIGNSQIFDDATNIGIGTTNADIYSQGTYKYLTISNINTNGYTFLTLAGGSGGGGEIDFGTQNTRHAAIASFPNSGLGFYSNSTNSGTNISERMRLTASGELLIATTTDAGDYKLQISGNLYTSNGAYFGVVGDNIGIGTTTPETKFHIKSTNALEWIETTTSNRSILGFQALNSDVRILSTYNTGGSNYVPITFWTSGAEKMRLSIDGELFINTTSDAGDYKLQISGNFYNTGSITTGAPSGGSIKPWKIGEAATVSPTSPNRTLRVEVDGVVYYIHAKTTND